MSVDDEHVRGMRWLYDDEKSYRKAVAKLKLEEAKAQHQKQVVREYRRERASSYISKAKRVAKHVSKRGWAIARPYLVRARRYARRMSRRQLLYAATAASVLVIVVVAGVLMQGRGQNGKAPQVGTLAAAGKNGPDFKAVVPKDINQNDVKYDSEKRLVSFNDTYGSDRITVSQQALPDKLKGDTKGLTDLAKSIGAKQIIETPRGKAYIATDDKTGGQMVVTYTTDLLIFLRSEKTLDPLEWSDYIANLTIKR